jgi:hypothetical protein
VLATRDGQVYFWKLTSDFALFLMDDQHRTRTLRLDKERPGINGPAGAQFFLNALGPGYHLFTTSLTSDAVLDSQDWKPGGGKPAPFDSAKAVQIAWKELKAILADNNVAGWQVDTVSALPLYGTGYRKWYYKIAFSKPGANAPQGILTGVAIFVDMNGNPAPTTTKQ